MLKIRSMYIRALCSITGTLRQNVSCRAVEVGQEGSTAHLFNRTAQKILFSPGKAFRTMLKNVSVQNIDEATASGTTGGGGSSPSGGSSSSDGDTPSGDSSGGSSDGGDSSGRGSFD